MFYQTISSRGIYQSRKDTFPTFYKLGGKIKEKSSTMHRKLKEKKEKARQESEVIKKENHAMLVERGSPKDIQKHIREFSSDELSTIQKRFASEIAVKKQIDDILGSGSSVTVKQAEKKSTKPITDATNFLKTNAANLNVSVTQAKSFYNTIAAINNSLRKNPSGTRGLTAGQNGYMTPIS
jgi:hypothetical protein